MLREEELTRYAPIITLIITIIVTILITIILS